MKRDSVEINHRAPQWSHNAVWNQKYMDFFPSNAFMASARSLNIFNRSKKMNCNYHARLIENIWNQSKDTHSGHWTLIIPIL